MTDTLPRYKIGRQTEQICALLGISAQAVLRRLGRPADFLQFEGRGVTAQEFFEGWDAMCAEAGRHDLPFLIGKTYAHGPFNPAFFSFTCSPDVRTGLDRLSLFKPLSGPLSLHIAHTDAGCEITMKTNTPTVSLPATFGATELVFLIEAIRTCTGATVVPLSAQLPADLPGRPAVEAFLGCDLALGSVTRMRLAPEDANRPLLSRNPEHWDLIEPAFLRELEAITGDLRMSLQVQTALTEMLPAGQSTIDQVADRLRMSSRSLQRHLKNEGHSFQSLLDATREALALSYLKETQMNIDEISYLLAYRDPNSFYRAFQGWTGMTPLAARNAPARLS